MMNERKRALDSLLWFEYPVERHVVMLSAFTWDTDEEYAFFSVVHIAHVLGQFIEQRIDASQVEAWANLIEGRDDIGFERNSEKLLKEVLHELANPVLGQGLSMERAGQILKDISL
jgi:hypothetical protein